MTDLHRKLTELEGLEKRATPVFKSRPAHASKIGDYLPPEGIAFATVCQDDKKVAEFYEQPDADFYIALRNAWPELRAALASGEQNAEPLSVGDRVLVFDRYRFAIPLKARIIAFSDSNDGVHVVLEQSNNNNWKVDDPTWVHRQQLTPIAPVTAWECPRCSQMMESPDSADGCRDYHCPAKEADPHPIHAAPSAAPEKAGEARCAAALALCRSALSIAERRGAETNWQAFEKRLKRLLAGELDDEYRKTEPLLLNWTRAGLARDVVSIAEQIELDGTEEALTEGATLRHAASILSVPPSEDKRDADAWLIKQLLERAVHLKRAHSFLGGKGEEMADAALFEAAARTLQYPNLSQPAAIDRALSQPAASKGEG